MRGEVAMRDASVADPTSEGRQVIRLAGLPHRDDRDRYREEENHPGCPECNRNVPERICKSSVEKQDENESKPSGQHDQGDSLRSPREKLVNFRMSFPFVARKLFGRHPFAADTAKGFLSAGLSHRGLHPARCAKGERLGGPQSSLLLK